MRPTYFPEARCTLRLVPTNADRDDVVVMQGVQPMSVRVESTPVNAADTFEATFEEPIFPLDPRAARAVGVDVHIGDAGGHSTPLDTSSDDHLAHLGTVDSIEKAFPRDDAATVTFEGRGYAAFLLDQDWRDRRVRIDQPLDEVARDVVETLPENQQMDVDVEGFPQGAPTVGGGTPKRSTFSAKEGATVWEGLSEIAKKAGALVSVRRDTLVVRPPRTVSESDRLPVFVAGHNVTDLTITREWGVQDLPNVLVQAIDPETREVVEGQYPDPFKGTTTISKSSGTTSQSTDIQVKKFQIRHPSPTTTKLDDLAEQIWRRFEQQQLEVEITTRELETWKLTADQVRSRNFSARHTKRRRNTPTFRLPTLQNGDQIWMHIDREARSVLEADVSRDDKRRRLIREGYRPSVADTLAASWLQIRGPMFVEKATHSIGDDGTYELSISAKNAITVDPDHL